MCVCVCVCVCGGCVCVGGGVCVCVCVCVCVVCVCVHACLPACLHVCPYTVVSCLAQACVSLSCCTTECWCVNEEALHKRSRIVLCVPVYSFWWGITVSQKKPLNSFVVSPFQRIPETSMYHTLSTHDTFSCLLYHGNCTLLLVPMIVLGSCHVGRGFRA